MKLLISIDFIRYFDRFKLLHQIYAINSRLLHLDDINFIDIKMNEQNENYKMTYRSAREFLRYVCNLPRFTYSKITNIGSFSMQQPNNRTTLTCGSNVFIT